VGNAALKQTALSLFSKCKRGATATEKKYSEFCGLFSYQGLLRVLNLCLCNKQPIVFLYIFLNIPLGLLFNAESLPEDLKCRRLTLVQGGLTFQTLTKTLLIYAVSYFNSVFHTSICRLSPPKPSRRNGIASMFSRHRVVKIVEYSPSCSSMEYCYSSFSLRPEFFNSLGQNIVSWTPRLMFLWKCEEIGKINLSWCLASADSKSITEPTRESMCVSIRQCVQATFAIESLQDIVRTSWILLRLPKSFLFLHYIHTQKRSRAI